MHLISTNTSSLEHLNVWHWKINYKASFRPGDMGDSDSDSDKIVKNAWGDMSDRSDIGDNFVHSSPLSHLSPYRIGDRSDKCDRSDKIERYGRHGW